ncbi:MAG: hypothetical protein L0Z50_03200 [Verrucomicrobiales bacterium]|nr:hypothetical protein [Verrucomicrobiales bacterium]
MKTKLIPTQNSLRKAVRSAMIDLLNQQLADLLDLGMQAKQAHWNLKGPHFIGLHELFDKVAEELEEFADDMAERAVELGGMASLPIRWTRHPGRNTSLHCRARSHNSGRRRAQPLTPPPRPRMPTQPICSPKCRAAWTNGCGWSKSTHSRRIETF